MRDIILGVVTVASEVLRVSRSVFASTLHDDRAFKKNRITIVVGVRGICSQRIHSTVG